jgi:hypothetical protein
VCHLPARLGGQHHVRAGPASLAKASTQAGALQPSPGKEATPPSWRPKQPPASRLLLQGLLGLRCAEQAAARRGWCTTKQGGRSAPKQAAPAKCRRSLLLLGLGLGLLLPAETKQRLLLLLLLRGPERRGRWLLLAKGREAAAATACGGRGTKRGRRAKHPVDRPHWRRLCTGRCGCQRVTQCASAAAVRVLAQMPPPR